MERVLSRAGIKCSTFDDAGIALQELQERALQNEVPDLVVIDVNAGMSGGEFCAGIIGVNALQNTPILLLTGATGAETCPDTVWARVKPVSGRTLLDTIGQMFSAGPAQRPAMAVSRRRAGRGAQLPPPIVKAGAEILLAEENDVHRVVLTQMLRSQGQHNYHVVRDSAECIRYVQWQQPRIILMGASLSGMSGLQVTRAIRAMEATFPERRRTIIIGMTDHAIAFDMERCLEAGMDDYLPKPISAPELRRKLALWSNAEDKSSAASADES